MTGNQLGGWLCLTFGVVLAVFADPLGRLAAKTDPLLGKRINVKWYQISNLVGGLLGILLGIIMLLGY
jgi:type IV secretory pathway TrbD component